MKNILTPENTDVEKERERERISSVSQGVCENG